MSRSGFSGKTSRVAGFFVAAALCAVAAPAQSSAPNQPLPSDSEADAVADAFGLGPQDYWVSVLEFTGSNTLATPNFTWSGTNLPYYRYDIQVTGQHLYAPVRLPAGASLTSMQCFFRKHNASPFVSAVSLYRAWHDLTTEGPGTLLLATVATTQLGNIGYEHPSISFDETIRYFAGNRRFTYLLDLQLLHTPIFGYHSFAGCNLTWSRQVTPAPASATFADVPVSHPQFRFIEALFASGISAGCGGGNYCPDATLTRGQMAVFLAAALGLHFPN